jgi:hypothetical protein
MAVAIIAGILFATFLTLVMVPVLYSLVDDFALFFTKHYARKEDDGEGGETRGVGPDEVFEDRPSEPEPEEEPEPVGVRRRGLGPDAFDPLPAS